MAGTAGPAPTWVHRLKKHDEDAWTLLYERYKQDFFKYANHLVHTYGSKVDPEDLLQDGVVRMMERIETFDETRFNKTSEPLRAWGCTIILNLFFDGGRKEKKLPESSMEDIDHLPEKRGSEPSSLSLKQRNMLEAIKQAKERLKPSERAKFEYIYEQHMDYKELAEKLRVKPKSAKTMLSRFKKKFEKLAWEIYRKG